MVTDYYSVRSKAESSRCVLRALYFLRRLCCGCWPEFLYTSKHILYCAFTRRTFWGNTHILLRAQAFMAEQRDDVTPEECKQRYDEYKADYLQRLTHSFVDVHRKEVR